MANILNPTNISFNGKQLQSVGQIDMGMSITQDISRYITFKTGVYCPSQFAYYYPTGDVGLTWTTCDDTASWSNTPKTYTLTPAPWQFKAKQCAIDFNGTVLSTGLANGMPTSNFVGSDVYRTISKFIIGDLNLGLWRWVFFDSTTESAIGGASGDKHINTNFPIGLVTWNDGLWSKNKLFGSSFASQDVSIPANAKTTTSDQTTVTGDEAYGVMKQLLLSNDPRSIGHVIKAQPDAQVLCTMTMYNALKAYFHSKTADAGYLYITQDKSMTFDGVPVYGIPAWDYWINRMFWAPNTTTPANSVWFKPHRVLFTTKSNIVVGINNQTVYDNLYGEYTAYDRQVRWVTDGLFDVQIAEPDFKLTAF